MGALPEPERGGTLDLLKRLHSPAER
jgi:hypothetical protein